MDNRHKSILGSLVSTECKITSNSLSLTFLLIMVAVNFQSIDGKSMPIDQQMLPSTSKIPMIFLGKLNYQQQPQPQPHQTNLYHHQMQQQQQHHHQQQHYQHHHEPTRQMTNFSPVAPSLNVTEPMAAKSTATIFVANPHIQAHHKGPMIQRPSSSDFIQTSASFLNEMGAKQTRRQGSQPEVAQAASMKATSVDTDENDSETDDNEPDEPMAFKSMSQRDNKDDRQKSSDDDQLIEPTRRQSVGRLDAQGSNRASVEAATKLRYHGPALNVAGEQPEAGEAVESAARREQENAEASEAEVADRSALDEQRQQQREIILAQAAMEAKAIKEQQESLLKQQALQQQMILRRQELDNRGNPSTPVGSNGRVANGAKQKQPQKNPKGQPRVRSKKERVSQQQDYRNDYDDDQSHSEQTRPLSGFVSKSSVQDEEADYSIRRPAVIRRGSSSFTPDGSIPKYGVNDLLPAAQTHSYGANYAPLHGYQKDYYQFAESFKKGQFHSGYKRGGNKLQISGHASQHKSHAEGHSKWNGHKGKGVSYWNYQHANKKNLDDSQSFGGH